jgi:hypothetical protein
VGSGKSYRNIISAEGHAGSGAGFPLTFAAVSRACILGEYYQREDNIMPTTQFRLIAKASSVFIIPKEEFQEGVMKGEVHSIGLNVNKHVEVGDQVLYLIEEKLTEFVEPFSGQKMHAIYYYKIIGKFEKIEETQNNSPFFDIDGI